MIRRPSSNPSLLVSIALHVIIVGLFVQAIIMPRPYISLFGDRKKTPVRVERIGFLRLPQQGTTNTPGKDGGNGKPVTKPDEEITLVAPRVIPNTVPLSPPSKKPSIDSETGTGPLVGGGGLTRGIRPSYKDPRLWTPPGAVVTAPKSTSGFVDSVVATDIAAYKDSVAALGKQRAPGDWTFEKDGKKYGIDSKYIRLGPVSIPTAVLAVLPLNVTANPHSIARDRAQSAIRSDIQYHAQLGMTETDFRRAVKAVRERKDRERAAARDSTKSPL